MSFAIITNSTTISATELNNNFYHIGQGDLLPMGGVSLTAETGQHNLGSSGNRWRKIYVNDVTATCTVSAPITFSGAVDFASTTSMSFPNGFSGYFPHIVAWEIYGTATNAPVGTFGAYAARTLNTSTIFNLAGASLTSNQITLPAGTYEADGWASGLYTPFRTRLYNVTDLTITANGTSAYADGGSGVIRISQSLIFGQFTILTSTVFELQQRNGAAYIYGEGNTVRKGVFSCVQIVRIG